VRSAFYGREGNLHGSDMPLAVMAILQALGVSRREATRIMKRVAGVEIGAPLSRRGIP
jgi:hypothetical protein